MREIADKIAEQYLYNLNSHPERDTGFVYHHGLRTAKIALKLREAIKEDDFPFYVKLIQDADLVDHFGSLDIWLGFRITDIENKILIK
jgi:hypothetical protein